MAAMVDKPDGTNPSNLASAPDKLDGPTGHRTIEDLAREARAHTSELENFSAHPLIPARELRRIWHSRVRPFWRLHLGAYQALTRRLVESGENYLAIDTAAEGMQFFGNDPKLILSSALASARCGAVDQAQQILANKERVLSGTPEYFSLLGRTHKDLWKLSSDRRDLEESYRCYYQDFLLEKDRAPRLAPFPGANAASMALLLGKTDPARTIAHEVLALLGDHASDYWQQVTRAECELVLGHIETARGRYRAAGATSLQPYANLMTTRAQARLVLQALGIEANSFDDCFPIPRVACFSGHRLDEYDRQEPRFPVEAAEMVKDRIREAAKKLGIGFGYSSAANGADILFLEVMQESQTERGAQARETYVNLPVEEADFIRMSVRHPSSTAWIQRFETVVSRATEVTRTNTGLPPSGIVFEYANKLSFGAAAHKARELDTELIVLAVWDGQRDDQRGGTGDLVRMAAFAGTRIEVISPRPESAGALPYDVEEVYSSPLHAPDEAILHALAFSVRQKDETATAESIAAIVAAHPPLATEVYGRSYHLIFETAGSAAATAFALLAGIAPQIEQSLGLHSLPVKRRMHPVSGTAVFSADLTEKAAELAALDPPAQIYATLGFSALSEQDSDGELRCEFLGHRTVGRNGNPEAVFRVVRSRHV
jgi:hypothetical protein